MMCEGPKVPRGSHIGGIQKIAKQAPSVSIFLWHFLKAQEAKVFHLKRYPRFKK